MGVPDRPGGAAGADDFRHIQRPGFFWPLYQAWRLDRLSVFGQGRRRQGARPATAPAIDQRAGTRDGEPSISKRPSILRRAARRDRARRLRRAGLGADRPAAAGQAPAPAQPRSRCRCSRPPAAAPTRRSIRSITVHRQPAARAGDGAVLHHAAPRRALRPRAARPGAARAATRPSCSPTSRSPASRPATSSSRCARIRSSTASSSRATGGSRTTRSRPEIRLAPRQIFTRIRARADVARIIELYRRQGRFAARVEPQIVQLDQNRVDVVFEIDEGPRSRVRQINIIGNEAFRRRRAASARWRPREARWCNIFSSQRHLRSRPARLRPAEAAAILPDPGLCRFPRRLGGRRADPGPARLHHHLRGRGRRALQVRRRHGRERHPRLQRRAAAARSCRCSRATGTTPSRSRTRSPASTSWPACSATPSPTSSRRFNRNREDADHGGDLPGRRGAARLCRADRHQRQHQHRATRSSAASSGSPRAIRSTTSASAARATASSRSAIFQDNLEIEQEQGSAPDRVVLGVDGRGARDRRAAAFGRLLEPRALPGQPVGPASATSAATARSCARRSIIRAIPSRSSSASPSPICSTATSRSASTSSGATINSFNFLGNDRADHLRAGHDRRPDPRRRAADRESAARAALRPRSTTRSRSSEDLYLHRSRRHRAAAAGLRSAAAPAAICAT